MNLKEKVKQLPTAPGVYLMKDAAGEIIYVGKSKNLKNRVQSYLQNSRVDSRKLEKLTQQLKDFDWIQLDTEFEALMLECQLIQELKPIYNRKMKTPDAYSYLKIDQVKGIYRIEITHILEDEAYYFGPFTSKSTLERAINGWKELLKIDCHRPYNRSTPCLNFSLGLCRGICIKEEAMNFYENSILQLMDFLNGTDQSLIKELSKQMENASSSYDFEQAAKLRDTINALNGMYKKQQVIQFLRENQQLVVLDKSSLKLFFIQGNRILYQHKLATQENPIECLGNAIKDYFQQNESPVIIDKQEIDAAQIVFSYIHSFACQYIRVQDEWLIADCDDEMGRAIMMMVEGK
ncbi:GIY-YIG nuclease family protein [Cytobacillus spongiae]|jgi:excinuclease ABC subunit C|uniref:UvrB/UvrC motif-containing protein n=1 Tax=Cytobacillus spongiae TaxID=2901381 RepID=UPI001F230F2C|nr:UvrB/UvrC motif-containing protein [Cytobacillus spongiae]UII56409.1 GIY-YIG nuclease family protein [Cytobacillus spongiae]